MQRVDRRARRARRSRSASARAGSCRCRSSRRTGGPGAISFHRATCSSVLRHGRAGNASAASRVIRADAVKDDQAALSGQVAERLGLGPGRDEEVAAARFDQRLGRLARAKAIAVGLDRRARRYARRDPASQRQFDWIAARSTVRRSGRCMGAAVTGATPARRGSALACFPIASVELLDRQARPAGRGNWR